MKPLDKMGLIELVTEATAIRKELESSSARLGLVYDALHMLVRRERTASNESQAYLRLANSGRRLSGMLTQSLRRAGALDRAVVKAKQSADDAELQRLEREKLQKEAARRKESKAERERAEEAFRERLFGTDALTTQEDLIKLYGEDLCPRIPTRLPPTLPCCGLRFLSGWCTHPMQPRVGFVV